MRMLLIILATLIAGCTISDQKKPDYIRIDQRGERDKPIGPLVISKEKIDVKSYEIPLVVSEEVFDQSIDFISSYPGGDSMKPEWGSFDISCNLDGKSSHFFTNRRGESVDFFTKWNNRLAGTEGSDTLIKYFKEFFLRRLGPK